MVIIGITGPTGAGKTTALQELAALDAEILDADTMYHQMLDENKLLRAEIENKFGALIAADGTFERKKLGAIVFSDPAALQRLNTITAPHLHTAIKQALARAKAKCRRAAAIDAIRLFESGLSSMCHVRVAILAPKQTRIARIIRREGISHEYAQARVDAQPEDAFYSAQSEYTLNNGGECPAEFQAQARALFVSILKTYT